MIKKLIKKTYKYIPESIKKIYIFYRQKPFPMNWTDKQREEGLAELYYRKTGEKIDFSNVKTFNEKIQWYKLYFKHPDFSSIVCKVNFKNYIREKLGVDNLTIPLVGWC